MLAQAPVIGFIPVTGFDIAESFYAGRLGLSVASRDPFALVLNAANGTTIRCVLTAVYTPQPFTILGWEVAELRPAVQSLKAAGTEPILYPYFEQDRDGIWTAPGGSLVAWFHDPFGNVLSLSQHKAAE